MNKKGKFIVFEGGEGCGKTSVISYLKERFSKQENVVFTREPGGTTISEKIRTILMDKSNKNMTALTELFLFCGARAQHVEEFIKPALDSGKHVISDRFDTSTIAYQIYGRNQIVNLMDNFLILNNIAKEETEPDVIIWLDVSPKIGLSRKEQSHEGITTRFDEEKMKFHRKVREGFKTCFEKSNFDSPISPVWHKIDTDNTSLDNVKKEVLNLIEKILPMPK